MATVSGTTITIYQGETLDISFPVVDADAVPVDLTGGAAVLTYKSPAGVITNVTGTIATTTVTVSFAHAVTQLMAGNYPFQLMCRNAANKIVMTRDGTIRVVTSFNPDAVAVVTP